MRLISFKHNGRATFGRVEDGRVVELATPSRPDLKSALAQGDLAPGANASTFALDEIDLLPVIPNPGKILCIGLNYADHRAEMGRAEAGYPTIFTRFADTHVAHGQPLVAPLASEMFDYEGELALVIGRGGRRISEAEALGHIAGYACYNDGSVRDWQNHSHQYVPGKNFPSTAGFGPHLVTADEIADPHDLTLTTRLNGQVVQQASTGLMLFRIPRLIAYISSFTHLSPGDVISTGTPSGVGSKRNPPLWMKAGDLAEVEISGVGTLVNPVVGEP